MSNPDLARLRHIREAAAAAVEMTTEREQFDLKENLMLAMALTRCLEIMGEAASRTTPAVRLEFPSIPFTQISPCETD